MIPADCSTESESGWLIPAFSCEATEAVADGAVILGYGLFRDPRIFGWSRAAGAAFFLDRRGGRERMWPLPYLCANDAESRPSGAEAGVEYHELREPRWASI